MSAMLCLRLKRPDYPRQGCSRGRACAGLARQLEALQKFAGAFDDGPKTVVYCKASLLTKWFKRATPDAANQTRWLAKKSSKNPDFFDNQPKTVS
jgi:hypothetical protein